jgi:two-component system cell cycle sensor histidine kinase/response regulator CckA
MQQEGPVMGSPAFGRDEAKTLDTQDRTPRPRPQTEWRREMGLGDAERLRHIQKMEVVGKFAGGIAHDLNNILTVIVGSSQLLLDHPEVGQSAGQRVQQILDAGFRAANLTSQLLSFSRKQTPRRVTLNLNRIIADSTNMIRFLVGNRIGLTTLLAADLQNISADPVQMEQILINLCVNARDAMPEGGSIFIESQNVDTREAEPAAGGAAMKPGRYVRFSVSDTGSGMDRSTLAQVFEPFFTTKQPDKGMGLGLATVDCIVKHGGGHVRAESQPGEGSVFSVYFPAVTDAAAGVFRDARENMRGSETILLVEDSAPMREAWRKFLRGLGYAVLEAADAERAQWILANRQDIAVMIADIRLPGISGLTLAECLRKVRPGLKVLQTTAPASGFVNHGFPDENTSFLRKPFTPDALARKLRGLLDRVQ